MLRWGCNLPLKEIYKTWYRSIFLYVFMLIIENTQQLFLKCSSLSHAYFMCREMIDLTLFQGWDAHCVACNLVTQKYPQSEQNYERTAWGKIPQPTINSLNKEVSSPLLSPFAWGLTMNNSFMNLITIFQ